MSQSETSWMVCTCGLEHFWERAHVNNADFKSNGTGKYLNIVKFLIHIVYLMFIYECVFFLEWWATAEQLRRHADLRIMIYRLKETETENLDLFMEILAKVKELNKTVKVSVSNKE